MVSGFSAYVDWFAKTAADDEDRIRIEEFRESVEGMRAGAHETVGSLHEYRDSLEQLQGISRPLTTATKRAAGAVSRIISIVESFEAFAARAVSLIDETLATFSPPQPAGSNLQAVDEGSSTRRKAAKQTATPMRSQTAPAKKPFRGVRTARAAW
jgi:hypothetical protein